MNAAETDQSDQSDQDPGFTEIPTGAVVVGVDRSEHADRAVTWAAEHASARGRPLALLRAVPVPRLGMGWFDELGLGRDDLVGATLHDSNRLLDEVATRIRADFPDLEVHQVARASDPREALVQAGDGAELVAVGNRGHGQVKQLLVGSVSMAVSKHAPCPAVVIRESPADGPVVIAVSGEPEDDAVIDFGFRLASDRGLPVTMVHCFWDVVGRAEDTRELPVDHPGYEAESALLKAAAEGPSQRHPSVPVTLLLSRGFVNVQLVRAARGAHLVVMGHQRKSFFRETFSGSMAPYVVEHADCSVAVLPVASEET